MSNFSFYSLLKEKNSASIMADIERFVNAEFEVIQTLKKDDISKKIQDLISKNVADFAKMWNISFTQKNSEYNKLIDNFESLVIKSLYPKLFASSQKERDDDARLEKLIRRYSFVTPKNLDIEEHLIDHLTIDLAVNKLSEINVFRSPKDKSIIIQNFCKIINYMINSNKKPEDNIGMQSIYPILVYALIRGNIHKIKSNVVFVHLFRHRTRLESEEEFYLSAMSTAIEAIESLTYKKMNIDKNEFLKKCEECESGVYADSLNKIVIEHKNEQVLQQPANSDQTLFDLELNKLYQEYFTNCDLSDIPLFKVENMYKDFKIVLSMIKDFKDKNSKVQNNFKENKPSSGNDFIAV